MENLFSSFFHFVFIFSKFFIPGTDTAAYTASALSFCLENLNKPVVITGSQLPIIDPLSDAHANLLYFQLYLE
jgi:hypothetical protein